MDYKILESFLNNDTTNSENKEKLEKEKLLLEEIEKLKLEAESKEIKENNSELDYEKYLSDKEKYTLLKLNKLSNDLNKKDAFLKDVMNQPLKDIIKNWSNTHQDILRDVTNYIQNSDIKQKVSQKNWWSPITTFIYDIIQLCIKDNRMFYLGITVIFIGLIFVFVNISE